VPKEMIGHLHPQTNRSGFHPTANRRPDRDQFDEVFDGFSRNVIQVITSSGAFPCINLCKLRTSLVVPKIQFVADGG